MDKYIISRAILFILPLTLLICQEKKIYGKVVDKDTGTPLFGANIIVTSENKETYGASTDKSGNYSFNIIQSGSYTLSATYIGYDELIEGISISPGVFDNPIDIELINPPVIIVIIVAVFFGLNFKILNLALPIFVPRISPNGAINPPSNIKKIIKIQATLLHIFSTS